jgi:outer membrane immunogenic protein
MLRHLVFGAAIVAASVSPVLAADLIIEEEDIFVPDEVEFDWSGPYIGVHAGWLTGTVDAPYGDIGAPLTDGNDPFGISGWLAGVHAGVNFQSGSFVGGVEALADYAPFTGDDAGASGDINGLEGQFLGTLAGRVGFAADTLFFYLSGGGAVLTANGLVLDPGDEETVGATFFGGTVGAGVEVAFDENVSARLDYRFYAFGQQVVTFPDGDYDIGFSPSFHTLTAGISVGF